MVPPVFFGKMAYFYTSDSDRKPHLYAYEYNPLIKAPELKCEEHRNNVDNPSDFKLRQETSLTGYHKITFVNLGANGVLYKAEGDATWTTFLCDPNAGTWTTGNPTFTDPTTLGTLNVATMTIMQVREDPDNTKEGTDYVLPDMYAVDTGGTGLTANAPYLMKVAYDHGTAITVTSSVVMKETFKIQTLTPEHIDVGRLHFVVMSPVNCLSDETTGSAITNASVRTYTFAPVAGPTDGWSCDDLPPSDTGTNAWALAGTRRRELNEYEKFYEELTTRQDPHGDREI